MGTYANKRYTPTAPVKKSAGQQVKEMAVYLTVMAVVYVVFSFLVTVITWPFRVLFMSDRQRFQLTVDREKAKVVRRNQFREGYAVYPRNPLYQYTERFKIHPEFFRGDPHNEEYRVWFENSGGLFG